MLRSIEQQGAPDQDNLQSRWDADVEIVGIVLDAWPKASLFSASFRVKGKQCNPEVIEDLDDLGLK